MITFLFHLIWDYHLDIPRFKSYYTGGIFFMKKFYSKKSLFSILKTISDKCKKLVSLMKNTPYFCKIEYKEITKSSIFDQRLSFLLIEYYVLQILKTYMDLTNNPNMIYVEETVNDKWKIHSLLKVWTKTILKQTLSFKLKTMICCWKVTKKF